MKTNPTMYHIYSLLRQSFSWSLPLTYKISDLNATITIFLFWMMKNLFFLSFSMILLHKDVHYRKLLGRVQGFKTIEQYVEIRIKDFII